MTIRNVRLFLFATLVILLAGVSPAVAGTCGDINNDGSGPNVADLTYLVAYLFQGGPPPGQMYAADVNGDGSATPNVSDLTYLVAYLFHGGPAPMCPNIGTVTDIDGNVYQTIKIGDQWWMMENLKVTHYRNGDPIPNVTDNTAWYNLTTGSYCNYNNDEGNVATYGRLYNWYAVSDSRNIAPAGWHVPTDEEWKQLEMNLGMSQAQADTTGWRGTDEGGKLKEAGTTHWDTPNGGATNGSGFTALPGGYRDTNGGFNYIGYDALFWSSTEHDSSNAWYRLLNYYSSQVSRYYYDKRSGYSVRCVRD